MSEPPSLELDWRLVAAGPFAMGSDPTAEHAPDRDEAPRHEVDVAVFRLGRTPVTNAQYAAFIRATVSRRLQRGRTESCRAAASSIP